MLIADQPISVTDTMWQRHRAKYHWQWIQYEVNNIKNQDILYPGNHNRCSATDNAEEAYIEQPITEKPSGFGGRRVIIIEPTAVGDESMVAI